MSCLETPSKRSGLSEEPTTKQSVSEPTKKPKPLSVFDSCYPLKDISPHTSLTWHTFAQVNRCPLCAAWIGSIPATKTCCLARLTGSRTSRIAKMGKGIYGFTYIGTSETWVYFTGAIKDHPDDPRMVSWDANDHLEARYNDSTLWFREGIFGKPRSLSGAADWSTIALRSSEDLTSFIKRIDEESKALDLGTFRRETMPYGGHLSIHPTSEPLEDSSFVTLRVLTKSSHHDPDHSAILDKLSEGSSVMANGSIVHRGWVVQRVALDAMKVFPLLYFGMLESSGPS